MIAISLGVALLAMWIQADAAGARRTGGVLIGSVIMLAVGTSLSSFCASQAEAYTLQCAALGASSVLRCVDVPGVRVSTHVYAWALGGCAVTLVATGVLLALRLEVTDAVLRHALKRGSLMSLAHATVLTNSAAGKIGERRVKHALIVTWRSQWRLDSPTLGRCLFGGLLVFAATRSQHGAT
jgi:hypothetical protein